MRLQLHVQPGAGETSVTGWHDGRVKIRLAARPIEGAANDALVRFLSALCGVPRSRVAVTAGQRGRRKTVLISGVSAGEVTAGLGLEPPLSFRG